MNGIHFGTYHSWDDFSLILQPNWEIEAAQPKIEQLDIPGGDGVLDFTEAFGGIKYKNRKLTFPFKAFVPRSLFWTLFSTIQNTINGQYMKIVIDSDPDLYYMGRITVDKWKADQNIGSITVECNCEPYKYKQYKTIRTEIITTSGTIIYVNSRMPVIPKFTLSAAAVIAYNGTQYALNAGETTTGEIVFREGNNVLTVTGDTTITVEYQEGSL